LAATDPAEQEEANEAEDDGASVATTIDLSESMFDPTTFDDDVD
jgi:hypothetical protein